MIAGQWKEKYNRIPREIKSFLLKGLAVFIVWQLVYRLLLAPIRIPDRFLTNVTSIVTSKILALFYTNVGVQLNSFKAIITIGGKKIIGIADPCNALEIYVLYTAFLLCYPATNKRRIQYLAIGLPLIFIVNIIRCCLLVWLNIKHRGWFDISHHYIFTTVIYIMVFYLWLLFSKKQITDVA